VFYEIKIVVPNSACLALNVILDFGLEVLINIDGHLYEKFELKRGAQKSTARE
jgi:hypothetical protein